MLGFARHIPVEMTAGNSSGNTVHSFRRQHFGDLLVVPLGCSLLGLGASLWAHIETWWPAKAQGRFHDFWALHLMLFALLLPVGVELLVRRNVSTILSAPRPFRVVTYILLAYYALNFYIFMYWEVDHLTSAATWRMMSSGWLLLFSVAALYYRNRLTKSRQ